MNFCEISYAVKKYFCQILNDIASRNARSLPLLLHYVILQVYDVYTKILRTASKIFSSQKGKRRSV